MAVPGFYRRVLPSPPAIDFASAEGKQLFSEALQNGTMEGFFKLICHFQTQSEPAYCGLASLSMVLNALAIDPGRKWKGPWRWYDESMLDCCEPLEKIQAEGITFGKVACLGQCAGANVESFHTNQSNIDDFRNHIIRCTSLADCHLITSYNRQHFKQTGTGHFSPIGGYHAGSDKVLILDVARFKYPPHWVPLPLLWEAMDTVDKATGRHRGFMLISKLEKAPSLLYTLSCKNESWISMVKYLVDDVPILLKSGSLRGVSEVLSLLVNCLPTSAGDFVKWVAEVRRQEGDSTLSHEEKGRLAMKEEVLQEVRKTELFKHLKGLISSATSCCSNLKSKQDEVSLSEIAANICCQGAAVLSGSQNAGTNFCCRATCVKCLKVNDGRPATVIYSTVVSGGNEQGVDMLVPVSTATPETSNCDVDNNIMMHPGSADVLTILILALPHNIWSDIKDKNLLAELLPLISTENLPDILQQEVLHLRRQLHVLQKCRDDEGDDRAVPAHP